MNFRFHCLNLHIYTLHNLIIMCALLSCVVGLISPYFLREEAEAREEKARLDDEQAKVDAIETDKKKVGLGCDCGMLLLP